MAKKKAAKTERVSLLPELSPEKNKELAQIIDRKGHLEYLCYMMLNDLNKRLPLREMIEREIKRECGDEELLVDFFEEGNCGAEGFTIPRLLEEWSRNTDRMMMVMAGRA
jgi:hypothetical protein